MYHTQALTNMPVVFFHKFHTQNKKNSMKLMEEDKKNITKRLDINYAEPLNQIVLISLIPHTHRQ